MGEYQPVQSFLDLFAVLAYFATITVPIIAVLGWKAWREKTRGQMVFQQVREYWEYVYDFERNIEPIMAAVVRYALSAATHAQAHEFDSEDYKRELSRAETTLKILEEEAFSNQVERAARFANVLLPKTKQIDPLKCNDFVVEVVRSYSAVLHEIKRFRSRPTKADKLQVANGLFRTQGNPHFEALRALVSDIVQVIRTLLGH